MTKVKCLFPVLLFIAGWWLASCKKENSTINNCNTSVQKLAGTYKVTSMQYKSSSTAIPSDALAYIAACEKDDLITLNSNGTFIHKDAGLVCQPNGNSNGNWSLNGSTFKMDGSEDATVESFDCKTLVLYLVNQTIPGDKMTITLTRQ